MSEDLVQSASVPLGRYHYLRLGSTTLSQLRKSKYVRRALLPEEASRKPDGIVFLQFGGVKAVVEVKTPGELTTTKLPALVKTYGPIAAAVCSLLILTDGTKTFWINAHSGQEVKKDGEPVRALFDPKAVETRSLSPESAMKLADLIELCDVALSADQDELEAVPVVNPTSLAQTVWQKIWVTTGKEPEKCLYNVVEIFVFKFLSDTGVLVGNHSFARVLEVLGESGPADALEQYAAIVRPKIRKLFPAGPDGTTIINGTIFVNEQGHKNESQAVLFAEVLRDFQTFDDQHGSMRNINREFKTRLYESFLRQSAGIRSLGQYFTPRNVVQTMVRMSSAGSLPPNARIGDPFCGVGGFLLETIAEYEKIMEGFEPKEGKVEPTYVLRGYDKGTDEKEDERTIILAKANMLIYFSDLLGRYNSPGYLEEFSREAFNKVFTLLRDNLGTFALQNEEPYDLILTNPPYVTSGSRALRNIIDDRGLSALYQHGRGTEALAAQWIIANTKPGGRAIVVVPDGLMNQRSLLEHIKDTCTVDSITALPSRTFYSTPKKTYILELTRKKVGEASQSGRVFMYLVSEIGESRDARRTVIESNDLLKMEDERAYFLANPSKYQTSDPRCKLVDWAEFEPLSHWLIERLWTEEERRSLGLAEEPSEVSEEEFRGLVAELAAELSNYADPSPAESKHGANGQH